MQKAASLPVWGGGVVWGFCACQEAAGGGLGGSWGWASAAQLVELPSYPSLLLMGLTLCVTWLPTHTAAGVVGGAWGWRLAVGCGGGVALGALNPHAGAWLEPLGTLWLTWVHVGVATGLSALGVVVGGYVLSRGGGGTYAGVLSGLGVFLTVAGAG